MKKNTLFVGLDVHKDTIAVAIAEQGREGEVRYYGTIPNTADAVRKLVKKLGPARRLKCCYEAGPCGYVLYWQLVKLGAECIVVAPSLIPKKSGNRVKTDRRDAEELARLHRSGDLTAVWVPDPAHEALRDLVRAREAAIEDQQAARNRLRSFLLRRGIKKPKGWSSWTKKHVTWVGQQKSKLEHEADRATFTDYLHEVEHAAERIVRLEKSLDEAVAQAPEQLREVVAALAALRGVAKLTAVTLVAEVGSFERFEKPSQLMGYCGLVPSEYSTGGPGKARRGKITKTGNAHLRRVLIESGWHYKMRPRRTGKLKKRQEHIGQEIREISWKAQHRLYKRYARLTLQGKPAGKAVTAVARELLGFIWDIAVRTERAYREAEPQSKAA